MQASLRSSMTSLVSFLHAPLSKRMGSIFLLTAEAGPISWVLGLYPLLAACVAWYSRQNEAVIGKIKGYLHSFEQTHDYHGYERYNQAIRHKHSGSQAKALRDALLATALLATLVVSIRALLDDQSVVAVIVMLVELGAMIAIVRALREP